MPKRGKTKAPPTPDSRVPGTREFRPAPFGCPACGSKNRGPDLHTAEQEYAGTTAAGDPYTHILKTRVACADCGQHYILRKYEHREPEPQPRSRRKSS